MKRWFTPHPGAPPIVKTTHVGISPAAIIDTFLIWAGSPLLHVSRRNIKPNLCQ